MFCMTFENLCSVNQALPINSQGRFILKVQTKTQPLFLLQRQTSPRLFHRSELMRKSYTANSLAMWCGVSCVLMLANDDSSGSPRWGLGFLFFKRTNNKIYNTSKTVMLSKQGCLSHLCVCLPSHWAILCRSEQLLSLGDKFSKPSFKCSKAGCETYEQIFSVCQRMEETNFKHRGGAVALRGPFCFQNTKFSYSQL
jgi:hypothetical protein